MGPHTQLALHHKTRFFKKLILITCLDGGPNLQTVIAMCNTKKKITYGEHFPLMANHSKDSSSLVQLLIGLQNRSNVHGTELGMRINTSIFP
jgi:hypothetical protein